MSFFLRPGNREDLEREIHRAVAQRGSCYVKDQTISEQLQATTEEQVMAWKQSYSERESLICQPYEGDASQDPAQEGVTFRKA